MTLSLGDMAPDFMADSTEGPIGFHSWIGDAWCVLFSHPKDFTATKTPARRRAATRVEPVPAPDRFQSPVWPVTG